MRVKRIFGWGLNYFPSGIQDISEQVLHLRLTLSYDMMDLGQAEQSICDDYIFGSISDQEIHDEATEEIDAINDETFGNDLQLSNNSELEDYAAQTACLRLDDAKIWDTAGSSEPPAPDASNVPLPYFDIFDTPSFSTLGNEVVTKLDSLWSHSSHNMYDLWGEQKTVCQAVESCTPQSFPIQDGVPSDTVTATPSVFSTVPETSQAFEHTSGASCAFQQQSSALPATPNSSTLRDLERWDISATSTILKTCAESSIQPTALNTLVGDVDSRLNERVGIVAPEYQRIACVPQQYPPFYKQHTAKPAVVNPSVLGVISVQLPPVLPPIHPVMLPLVPVWLENLIGRTPCLPPGCPPIPPLFRVLFDTVKDPVIVMDMLRTASGIPLLPPRPCPPPTKNFERRTQWQRKPPGMPSFRTIEDLAFDQFAGYMSCKEREWLVKIQVLQCQGTGVPYDDDYYYTNWHEKQVLRGMKSKLDSSPLEMMSGKADKGYELQVHRDNGIRSQFDSKESIPLNVKFAGSLGLPSRSSTSNPRHLINVEPSLEITDEDSIQRVGKQRKLRTLLLRLESALALLIECDDIRVRSRNSGQHSEALLSGISQRIDVVYTELIAEDLLRILQIGKGRYVVARAISLGSPDHVVRIVSKMFAVMGSCPKKFMDDISCSLVPSVFDRLMSLNGEDLLVLLNSLDAVSIKDNVERKNIFCRNFLLTLLLVCAEKKTISQNMIRCLREASDEDLTNGWSLPISSWRKHLPGVEESNVQMLVEWLLFLCDNDDSNSLGKLLAESLSCVDSLAS
ncbi:hypothetical protein DICVIV_03031 [Dictyocaulus viviparus]|uniref:Uncharacterized protein n=1 Tax=Dictyocaulus viviparus TaxID=29172 RepID=A0A0D8Y887_DICVI|nr:hypothetical protein DICVIV_03031 [Dictyocaulus viviparus]